MSPAASHLHGPQAVKLNTNKAGIMIAFSNLLFLYVTVAPHLSVILALFFPPNLVARCCLFNSLIPFVRASFSLSHCRCPRSDLISSHLEYWKFSPASLLLLIHIFSAFSTWIFWWCQRDNFEMPIWSCHFPIEYSLLVPHCREDEVQNLSIV